MMLVVTQSLLGKFGDAVGDVWGWLLPTLIPTLSLILGVLIVDSQRGAAGEEKQVDRFLYRLAIGLSLGYLAIVVLPFAIQPLTGKPILDVIQLTHYWLGPVQGLVAGILGVFFVKGEAAGN